MKGTKTIWLFRTALIVAAILWFPACTREELSPGQEEEGIPVTATLSFGAPDGGKVDITTKAELNDYSDITSLCLFIFNADGSRCEDVIKITDENDIRETGTSSTGRYYETDIRTTTGSKRIFAIANYISVQSWVSSDETPVSFLDKIESLAQQALAGELTMAEVGNEIVMLRSRYISNGTTPEYPTQQMIFSSDIAGDAVTFTLNGASSGIINLQRIVANVIFNIKSGTRAGKRISFTPTSYRLYNISKGTRLGSNRAIEENPMESDPEFYYDGSQQTITTTATGGEYTFDFFLPENIQDSKAAVTEYTMRDEWDFSGAGAGASNGEKTWTYAPANASYIEINGEYAEYNVPDSGPEELYYSGTATYVIHLGDFSPSGSMGDYSVRRNWKYTYNITVNGVDSIVAEAIAGATNGEGDMEQGDEPGAEGDIVNINDITLSYSLDAHYEQVLLQYNISSIANTVRSTAGSDLTADEDGNGITDVDEAIGQCLILYCSTPFQTSEQLTVPYMDYLEAVKGYDDPSSSQAQQAAAAAKERFLAGIDYKWVEFYPQSSGNTLSAYPGLPDWKNSRYNNDGTLNNSYITVTSPSRNYLLDAYDVCVKIGKAVKKLLEYRNDNPYSGDSYALATGDRAEDGITVRYTGGNWYTYFTGFVDEYYYTRNPVTDEAIEKWSEFTNARQRRLMISMDIQVSDDGKSTYSRAHTNISQRSIQTFYDDTEALDAFGMETFDEGGPMPYGTPSDQYSIYSDTDGRSNTTKLIDAGTYTTWNTYIDPSHNGHLTSVNGKRTLTQAYKRKYAINACLSRNRDLNGDSYIDDNEIRWYMPSINEYIRMGMGANAISNEAQLYTGDKDNLDDGTYPVDFLLDGALYVTSTYRTDYTGNSQNKTVFWAVEKGSYGGQINEYGDKLIRCVRLLPADVDGSMNVVAAAVCEEKATAEGNIFLDFRGRLTPSLFRQIPNPSPYNFVQHDEDSEYNRFYDALIVAKNYMSTTWPTDGDYYTTRYGNKVINTGSNIYRTLTVLQNIGNNQNNPCADYSESGEPENAGWRLPNLVELTVLASNYDRYVLPGLQDNGNVPCCTQFSNQNVRQAFYINSNEMVTCGDEYNGDKPFYIRCVRDATDEELAAYAD
ncbi:MAG: DUF4906 domain-containing protein [Bacteroidetes bacterium]|uniref:DUF4906 domain-containing protein n=1 Tax=Candidatus Cryptobacteroides excrementavium TaxID=2840759 RepID=A0A9D9J3T3_9BACT|nr:DUF4906 domain-containing protein [Candidatus Cryptobacteroides excrementavium]